MRHRIPRTSAVFFEKLFSEIETASQNTAKPQTLLYDQLRI